MDIKTLQEMIDRAKDLTYNIQNLSSDQLLELEEIDAKLEAHYAPLRVKGEKPTTTASEKLAEKASK